MKKIVLFDFDGTIADTVDTAADILNDLSTKYGYAKVTKEENKAMRDLTIQEMFKMKNVAFYKLPFMIIDVKRELNKRIVHLNPIKGMATVLKELKKKDYKLAIITSNSKENVEHFLESNNLNFFDHIYTGTTLFGKAKVIQGFLKKNNVQLEKTIYIGDEMRDIEATKKVGIPIISVTWGLNSRKGLQRFQPEFLIDNPNEILSVLGEM
jgi:phosphoglycolate phosphatase